MLVLGFWGEILMMAETGISREEDEEFFDSRDDVLAIPAEIFTLTSAQERRHNFMKWMGMNPLGGWDSVIEVASISDVISNVDEEDAADDSIVSVVDEPSDRGLSEACSSRVVVVDEFERSFGPSSSSEHIVVREDCTSGKVVRRKWRSWLRWLGMAACIMDRQGDESDSTMSDSDSNGSSKVQRVRVRPYKKRFKEFSAIYMGQDIKAHEGGILTMKFSHDGRCLASGGEDGVVCVWGVEECARIDEGDVPVDDPSCVYFKMDTNYKLAPLCRDKEKKDKLSTKKSSDSACVIIPPDIFQLSEKPLHIFRGHDRSVLDLSWSKNKCLLSSSTDKTVRLWRVGCNSCLKVFSHNNYVTCVQFNPVDENYFISGSIDGKVRIWEIPGCQVVDWIEAKEIVTAVCYRPDGRVGVVGFMSGDCHFYDVTGNHLQLDAQISLQIKKKFPYRRITGFQFSPSDHEKLMVISADSQIRILNGFKVTCKYRGLRNAGSPIYASFTSDGRHIVSAGEDSYVYIWSHTIDDSATSRHAKNTWSRERFFSSYVSVAIPWHGLDSGNPVPATHEIPQSSSSMPSHDFFSELLPKGSATWPEEQLTLSSMTKIALCRSHYKFLRTSCQNTRHAWGQVVVTGGCDGRIRSFRNYGLPVHV